jgi:hypothetical protein
VRGVCRAQRGERGVDRRIDGPHAGFEVIDGGGDRGAVIAPPDRSAASRANAAGVATWTSGTTRTTCHGGSEPSGVTRSPVPSTSAPPSTRKKGMSEPSARASAIQSRWPTAPKTPSIAARKIAPASLDPPPKPAPTGIDLRKLTAKGAAPKPTRASARTTRLSGSSVAGSQVNAKRAAGTMLISSAMPIGSMMLRSA